MRWQSFAPFKYLETDWQVRYIVSHAPQEKIMAASAMVHVRVDEKVKAEATQMLAEMGLSVSDAVRVFLMRVIAEKQLPFALKVPNAETRAAMAEADDIVKTRRARFATANELFNDLEKNSGK
jgi:DNA-damage-inducible protein J